MPEIEDAQVVQENPPVPMRALRKEIYEALVGYLDTKPHQEVRGLIDSVSSSPVVNVTFQPAPPASTN